MDATQAKVYDAIRRDMIGYEAAQSAMARSQSAPWLGAGQTHASLSGGRSSQGASSSALLPAHTHGMLGATKSADGWVRGATELGRDLLPAEPVGTFDDPDAFAAALAPRLAANCDADNVNVEGTRRPGTAPSRASSHGLASSWPARPPADPELAEGASWRGLLWCPGSGAMELKHEQRAGRWSSRETWQMEAADAPPQAAELSEEAVGHEGEAMLEPSPLQLGPPPVVQDAGRSLQDASSWHAVSARPPPRPRSAEGSPLVFARPMAAQLRARIASLEAFRPHGKAELSTWAFALPKPPSLDPEPRRNPFGDP